MSGKYLYSGKLSISDPSPCPGRGQARLARAGDGSIHAVAYSIQAAHVADSSARSFPIPLPVQRLSIFSVFRKAMHANAQLFCSLGPKIEKIDSPCPGRGQTR